MEVKLFVYDLSQGLARQFSQQFLGSYIDAVYHTSIVLDGIEYLFGAGIQSCRAGTTHHGQPMEVVELGRTELPIEVILEYLDGLKEVYSPESYNLFLHNCNNFSNDFAMFLVGQGIPKHITSLPETVLNTPFGQMLKPQLERSMRSITQSSIQPEQASLKPSNTTNGTNIPKGRVQNVTTLNELQNSLSSASNSCAVIFFTSSTCAPCKILYPTYDELAEEAGNKAVLIKVDINYAHEISRKYNVRATPTIMTFLKGQKEEEWAGADVNRLKSSVKLLIQTAYPPHPHSDLRASALLDARAKPIKYTKIPPLDKLSAKLGSLSNDPVVNSMKAFLSRQQNASKQDNPLPSLSEFGALLRKCPDNLPAESLFAAYDLLRIALTDFRVCAYFAEESGDSTLQTLLHHTNSLGVDTPYSLQLVTLNLSCNILGSSLSRNAILRQEGSVKELLQLIASSLLDEGHANVRVAAASLSFNIAAANHMYRTEKSEELVSRDDQVELVAAIIESLAKEEDNKEVATGLVMALALLVYMSPPDSEILDLCRAMDAPNVVALKASLLKDDASSKSAIEVMSKGLR